MVICYVGLILKLISAANLTNLNPMWSYLILLHLVENTFD